MGSRSSGNRAVGEKRAEAGRRGKNKSNGWERQVARRIEAIVARAERADCRMKVEVIKVSGVRFHVSRGLVEGVK